MSSFSSFQRVTVSPVLVLCLALQTHSTHVVLPPWACALKILSVPLSGQRTAKLQTCHLSERFYYSVRRREEPFTVPPARHFCDAPFNAGNVCLVLFFARRNRVALRPVCCTKTESVLHQFRSPIISRIVSRRFCMCALYRFVDERQVQTTVPYLFDWLKELLHLFYFLLFFGYIRHGLRCSWALKFSVWC